MGLVTPDFGLLFWMLISFGLVVFILKKFAWKPILQALKDREYTIAESLSSAENAKIEMKNLHAENKKIMQQARAERDTLLREAKASRDKIIRQSEEEAKNRANKILEDAHKEIINQKKLAIEEIKEEVAELSVQIAEKILTKELQAENKQKEYINGLLEEVKLN